MPRITGTGKAQARLAKLSGREKVDIVGRALFAAGETIKAEASRLITTGAVSGKSHVPSAPGEAPNEDTGHLRSQIEVTQVAPLRVQVASNARYAASLEFGTSKMAARPYMGPAARAKKRDVVAKVNAAIDHVVKG